MYFGMSLDPWTLFLSMIFSSIGLGFFIYGKKQSRPLPLVVGIILMVYPYFTPTPLSTIVVGIILIAIPVIAAMRN
jgi:hypothetical protein